MAGVFGLSPLPNGDLSRTKTQSSRGKDDVTAIARAKALARVFFRRFGGTHGAGHGTDNGRSVSPSSLASLDRCAGSARAVPEQRPAVGRRIAYVRQCAERHEGRQDALRPAAPLSSFWCAHTMSLRSLVRARCFWTIRAQQPAPESNALAPRLCSRGGLRGPPARGRILHDLCQQGARCARGSARPVPVEVVANTVLVRQARQPPRCGTSKR